ncbi:hypothetical protein OVA11_19570 [Caulobacter sp. SL161]|uniref:hypothetical protein n=1 Tax=Caulobacter sp. SL161 TaxID=2995156 RepID=UPI002273F1F5|nr:hypothetical protein [Caulobacter sp. SL161]MCY1649177.1 hypothetical protein [Caulobacter sp. SL161]
MGAGYSLDHTAGQTSCTAHVVLAEGADAEAVRRAISIRPKEDFDLHHLTIQTERTSCADLDQLHP